MTEEANKHTEATKSAYESQRGDIEDEGHVTSNDVNLADYPGKAEALREGQEAREKAEADRIAAEDTALNPPNERPAESPEAEPLPPQPVQPTRVEGE